MALPNWNSQPDRTLCFGDDVSPLRLRSMILRLTVFLVTLVTAGECLSEQWPQFRGPTGQGLVADQTLPTKWSDRENVLWRTPIAGLGWSSPVIQGNQIWLTTAVDSGRSLRAVCVERRSGTILHDIEVFRVDEPGKLHPKNSHASPTPVIAGGRLFVHFGAHGTACLSTEGEILWTTKLPYYHHHGPAASPVLVDGVLVVSCDGYLEPFWDQVKRDDVTAPQFIVGLSPETGELIWKQSRMGRHSYATPLAIQVDGKTQVISPGGDSVTAYDPSTGEELWWCRFQGYSLTPRPVYGNGLVYICTGYDYPWLLAIRPSGTGDVTDTHVAWRSTSAIPLTPSPLLLGTELYLISDNGIASCYDAISGRLQWKKRLGGNYSASPIAADGRLYVLSEDGQMHILKAGPRYEKLGNCSLEGRTFASPAAVEGSLFLRTDEHLVCIADRD